METRYYMDITLSRILELMQNEGLTAHQLEVRAGLSNASVQAWRNGRNKPSLDAISKLSDYFDVSVDYLLGKTNDPTPPSKGNNNLFVPKNYENILIALNNGADNLSQEDIDNIVKFIEFTKNNKQG